MLRKNGRSPRHTRNRKATNGRVGLEALGGKVRTAKMYDGPQFFVGCVERPSYAPDRPSAVSGVKERARGSFVSGWGEADRCISFVCSVAAASNDRCGRCRHGVYGKHHESPVLSV